MEQGDQVEGSKENKARRRVSRRRYSAVLKMLREAVSNERLSWSQRMRAAELVLLIYGTPLPESGKRDKKTIRELVTEHTFDRAVKQEVDRSLTIGSAPVQVCQASVAPIPIANAPDPEALFREAFADVISNAKEKDLLY